MRARDMTYHPSLLTAIDSRGHVHLIVGSNPLAAARCSQSLAVGASPILVAREPAKGALLPAALQAHVDAGDVQWVRQAGCSGHLETLGRDAVGGFVDAVFITDYDPFVAEVLSSACRQRRIPVNVVDRPDLCTFSLLSTHTEGPLQIGITTNGTGCGLAARIRREIVAALPTGLGTACVRLGALRRRIQEEDKSVTATAKNPINDVFVKDDLYDQNAAFHQPILFPETNTDTCDNKKKQITKTRRIHWLTQIYEYWPLKRLVGVTNDDVEALLKEYTQGTELPQKTTIASKESTTLALPTTKTNHGRIILAGSGPGHPDLLTRAVHRAILTADVVLADKLVPQGVLDLIPRHTEVVIARKFPGNADAAQEELIEQATAAARAGKTVLRLKQGDPFIYGRGGEEVLRLRTAGFQSGHSLFVLPGITSALCGPLVAGIPPTHRDAADQVLICTGMGKQGKPPAPPGYRASRTAIFLMALHRITALVAELTTYTVGETETDTNRRGRALWPTSTPCAVIERASCPDQKIIRTTLAHVAAAVEQEGSRPPGLLVVGRTCDVLYRPIGDGSKPWSVEECAAGLDLGSMLSAGRSSLV